MPLGIDPTVDYVFKKLFGSPENSDLLVHLLNAVLTPRTPIVSAEILNPFNEKEFDDDKLSVLDIKACDAGRTWFNIEMQSTAPGTVRKRIAYYNARLLVEQLKSGESYDGLVPAIGICFLKERLFVGGPAPHLRFTMTDVRHGVELTDCLQIHTIELPAYNLHAGQLAYADTLSRWVFFLAQAAAWEPRELVSLLPGPAFRKAVGVVEMIARTPDQREQYEARLKAERDRVFFVEEAKKEAREQGLQEGRAKGEVEGRARGELEGRVEGQRIGLLAGQVKVLQSLLHEAETRDAELLEMDAAELTRLCDELKAKLESHRQ